MPTATSYITTTGQSGGDVAWTSLSNADGAPDATAAAAFANESDEPAGIAATHAIAIPASATIDAVRIIPTWCDTDSPGESINFDCTMNGKAILSGNGVRPPQGALAAVTYSGVLPVGFAASDVNAGVVSFAFAQNNGVINLLLDAVQIQVDYTVARNVAPYCNRKFVKSPLIQLP